MADKRNNSSILLTAWAAILIIALHKIVLQEILHINVSENLQSGISLAVILCGLVLTYRWQAVRPLRAFFGLFLVMVCAQWLVYTRLDQIPAYQRWLNNRSFNVYMPAEQSLNLIVTIILITYLFLTKKQRQLFFLARGDTAAQAEPVRWLGIKPGDRWNKIGRIFTIFISMGTLAFLVIAGRSALTSFIKVLPFLPVVFLSAGLNAFNEEMTYKASFLSMLEGPVGKQNSLLLMAAYFGIGHFYGIPYGITGVLMATFLGWFLGKSMLETRGMFWAWFIHFWQDVFIFLFLAIGSVTAGG